MGYGWHAPLGLLFGIHDRLTQAVGLGYGWHASCQRYQINPIHS